MKSFILKICLISTVCVSSVCAMESEFAGLEVRNGSKFPAKVTVHYNIPSIEESSLQPISVSLDPITTDGVQSKRRIPNPKRYGLMSIEVDEGIKFYNVVDLMSEVVIGSNGNVIHFFNNTTDEIIPEWLYKSLTFKKFDLRSYADDLLNKWNNLNEDQKQTPYIYIKDFPSCLHGVNASPEIVTPFPFCLKPNMKIRALNKYKELHPEIMFSDDEILALEAVLKEKGLPFIH